MAISTFGMVTILLLTLVTSQTLPVKLWSSNTTSPHSTWEGSNNKLGLGTWKPSYYVVDFLGKPGATIQKRQQNVLTTINPSLNGKVLNPTTIPDTFLIFTREGDLKQTYGNANTDIFSFKNPALSANIWSKQKTSHCVQFPTVPNNPISFAPCNQQSLTQRSKLVDKRQVYSMGKLCLDVSGSSAIGNTCNPNKATQNWKWNNVTSFLQVIVASQTRCLRINTVATGTSFGSVIGACDAGAKLTWKQW
jgi:hypothetical protein